jgi:sigma-B regulation protein RsbU (phosphoserine phosphatase)
MGLNKNTPILRTIGRLNRVIQRSINSTSFVSLFIGEIEDSAHLFYVNAGHPPPFLVSGKVCHSLNATGIALGFLPDVYWHRDHILFNPGDILVLYSDGIIERERNPEEQFGIKRLQKVVLQNRNMSAADLVSCVYQAVFDFGKKKAWADDATLVVIKRLENPNDNDAKLQTNLPEDG